MWVWKLRSLINDAVQEKLKPLVMSVPSLPQGSGCFRKTERCSVFTEHFFNLISLAHVDNSGLLPVRSQEGLVARDGKTSLENVGLFSLSYCLLSPQDKIPS